MNHRFYRKSLFLVARALAAAVAIALVVIPIDAHAQFTGNASATAQFEHDSNVYDLSPGLPAAVTNGRRGGDSFLAYQGELDARYLWSLQDFYASASATKFDYQHFTALDHNDYNLQTGLNWKIEQILDGKLEVARSRSMVQFYNLEETTLSVSTVQRELAQIGLKLPDAWRLEGAANRTTTTEPTPLTPDLQLKETSGTVAAKYQGITGFNFGANAGYISGDFEGTNSIANPNYRQTSEGLLTSYRSARSTIDAQLGYSRRISATGTNNTSGVTGELGLVNQLTPKTDISFKLNRVINSFVTNAGSETDTGANLSVNWKATFKLQVSAGYIYTYREYPGQGNDPLGSDRIDHEQLVTFRLDYRPQRWLSIKPYGNYQTRGSNFVGGAFNATSVGVYVTVLTPPKAR